MVRTRNSLLAWALRALVLRRRELLAIVGLMALAALAVRPAGAQVLYAQLSGELDLGGSSASIVSWAWTGSYIESNYAGGANTIFCQSLTLHADGTETFEESVGSSSFGPVTQWVSDTPLDPYPTSFTSNYHVVNSFNGTQGWTAAFPSETSNPHGWGSVQQDVDENGDWVVSVSGSLNSCTSGDFVTWEILIYP